MLNTTDQQRALTHLLTGDDALDQQAYAQPTVGGALSEVHLAVTQEHMRGRGGGEGKLTGQHLSARSLDHLPGRARGEAAVAGEQVCVHGEFFGRHFLDL